MRTLCRAFVYNALLVAAVILGGCSKDAAITDPNKLCAYGAGVGARISGAPNPVELCVPNDETTATYTDPPDDRYDLTATGVIDTIEVTIEISFRLQNNQILNLRITSDRADAFADPSVAWFSYREVKPGVYDYSTRSVSGDFRLTVSDSHVATGTFTNLTIELEETTSGIAAGTRMISEGFFSVTPD
jgi:hypothetical protein